MIFNSKKYLEIGGLIIGDIKNHNIQKYNKKI